MEERGRCVLLVEDDRFLRKAAEMALRQHGFTVLTGVDGEEALVLARSRLPDLILLDLIMPKIQGFEVLQCLKEGPTTAHIPVVVLSNLGQPEDKQRAMDAGAIGYLIKANVSIRDLVRHVEKALQGADNGVANC